jgi:Transglutaminase-like superfamily
MKEHRIFRVVSFFVNALIVASLLLTLFGTGWEYSTRRYLAGFADAVIPFSPSPEIRVAGILAWMARGPMRQAEKPDDNSAYRNPEYTLNYQHLLRVCGTATNAFVNLASAGGIEARRLLLLDASGRTSHVVAEVHLDGRWVVVDPAFRAILMDDYGHLLTRQELAQPSVLREATADLPGYDIQKFNYENTTHVHLMRVPYIGRVLPRILNVVLPGWEEDIDWSILLERESFATMITGIAFVLLSLSLRLMVNWYGRTRRSVVPIDFREQLRRGSGCVTPE